MKNVLIAFAIILALFIAFVGFLLFAEPYGYIFEYINYSKDEMTIVNAFNSIYGYEYGATILKYYGKYESGAIVANLGRWNSGAGCAITQIVVADYVFYFSHVDDIDVYYDGNLYTLAKSYEYGFLTESDIAKIHAIHTGNNEGIKSSLDDIVKICSSIDIVEYADKGITVYEMIHYSSYFPPETIDNFTFESKGACFICVQDMDGNYYSLSEAYENGYISYEDLEYIYEYHNNIINSLAN